MGKGYKLTSIGGDGLKQCAFFFSSEGCRNGANCKFSHEGVPDVVPSSVAPKSPLPPSVSSSSVMSSETESSGEIIERRAGAYASLHKAVDDSNPFFSPSAVTSAPPSNLAVSQETSKEKKPKKRSLSANGNPLVFGMDTLASKDAAAGHQKGVPAIASPLAAPPQKKQKKQSAAAPLPSANVTPPKMASFRNLQLPVASFASSSTKNSVIANSNETQRSATPQDEPAQPKPTLPLPKATPSHLKWLSAVQATQNHPTYNTTFDFDRTQKTESEQGISSPHHWIKTVPYGDWCENNPAAIAIDCEMCETKDPVTGTLNTKALCRISVINADNPDELLLDTLVKPEWPVFNYRTWVNGITEKDLENVQFTLRHAQTFMNALCSDQTVIVGHALHNDLMALRMIHHCNVDTAMLYTHATEDNDANTATPSLKNLAHGVLQRTMPDVHDSVNDAGVALACALHYCSKDGKVEPVEKVFRKSTPRKERSAAQPAVLLVHRLPKLSKPSHIWDMMLAFTCVQPKVVSEITFSGEHGRCDVEFMSKDHAELAYRTLTGEEREDKTGKKQKRLKLKNGGYFCVRKMVA